VFCCCKLGRQNQITFMITLTNENDAPKIKIEYAD
jgi:hypothetical protein